MSKLTKCKDCGQEVSKRADICPHCGVKKPWGDPAYTARVMFFMFLACLPAIPWWR
jgi:uncharacterized OB-fold protein